MRRLLIVPVLVVLLVSAACSGTDRSNDGAAPPPSGTEAPGATGSVPDEVDRTPASFAEGECPVPVPVDAGVEVTCGVLSVPENRLVADSDTIQLQVARIHSRSANPGTPVVELGGGPGFPSVRNLTGSVKSKLLDDHDFILWDQRGIGFSTPSLDCAETNEATWEMFRTTDDPKVEGQRIDASIEACRDRLVADGIDLNGYTTTQVVADLDDLRQALGIEEWNLYGGSYGTSVAVEALRQDLPGIRSVLIDSVEPPDEPFGAVARGESATRAFEALYDACAAQATCTETYGDLRVVVADAMAALEASPYTTTITDPATGQQREITITAQDFIAGLFTALYDPKLIPVVPAALQSIADGDQTIIGTLASSSIPFAAGAAEGMTTSINCADRGRLLDADAVDPFVAEHPQLAALLYVQNTDTRCLTWGVDEVPEAFNQLPAPASIPVLVVAGAFDPITPPAGAGRVADALGVELLTFPDAGHGAIGPSPCSVDLYLRFLADPAAPLDTSCMADLRAPTFG